MTEWVEDASQPSGFRWTGDDQRATHNPDVDPAYPRIRPHRAEDNPRWPDGWGSEPTERDRAVMGTP